MSIKMGGYICDRCRVVVLEPTEELYGAILTCLKPLTIRIFCKECGEVVERVEHTMKLHGSKHREGADEASKSS